MFHSLMNFMLSPIHYIVNLKSHDWSDFFFLFLLCRIESSWQFLGQNICLCIPQLWWFMCMYFPYKMHFWFCGGLGGYMCYGLHGHTLFHICEDGLKGVTFYYTKPKYKKKMPSNLKGNRAWECMQRGPCECSLYAFCILNAPIHIFVSPMPFEAPYKNEKNEKRIIERKVMKMKGET